MAVSMQSTSPALDNHLESTNVRAMSIATMLFFMWGFLTCLNDILIPHLKSIFELGFAQAMMVQFAFFSSYFVFAQPAGKVVEWIGYKRTMVAGLLVMALGALLFVPAASVASFPLFLGALIVLAAGITSLQVAANPYVANLGPARTASSRLNLSQAFNSLGTTVAPFFGAAVILSTTTLAPGETPLPLRRGPPDLPHRAGLHRPHPLHRHCPRPHPAGDCNRGGQAPQHELHPGHPPWRARHYRIHPRQHLAPPASSSSPPSLSSSMSAPRSRSAASSSTISRCPRSAISPSAPPPISSPTTGSAP